MYDKLSGMTGTAKTEEAELKEIYDVDVVVVPTNRPIARLDQEDVVYKTEDAKFNALIDDIVERHAQESAGTGGNNQHREVRTVVEVSESPRCRP